MKSVLVTGAGGFIAGHLCAKLKELGCRVIGADIKEHEFRVLDADFFYKCDLRYASIKHILQDFSVDEVYHLAALMGGIAAITKDHAGMAAGNARLDLNVLEQVKEYGKPSIKFLYSSSACVYNTDVQQTPDAAPLKESDAWPCRSEEGYGLQKLYTEKLLQYFNEDYGLDVRVVRFHNVAGPLGTWCGGLEKAPAAVCRKVAELPLGGGAVEVWGDGLQTRTFMHVSDCVEGLIRLMASDYTQPLNLGRDEVISVNGLYDLAAEIAGKSITKIHDLTAPQGVRGRSSDNTKLQAVLGWCPQIDLRTLMEDLYPWVNKMVNHENKEQCQ